ncbi:MAG: hypothetical protein WDA03_11040 [Trueperaceae bacterium]
MRPAHLTPITDAEVQHAVNALKRYPNGLTRADLERVFGSDRRGRAIMAALTERGIAPVITTPSAYGDGKVYRLARTAQEVNEAVATLRSYRDSLDARITGLQRAWEGDGQPAQANVFELFGMSP